MSVLNLEDRIALVTGASSGLGVQFAKALAKQGVKIALVARREEKLQQTKKIVEKIGAQCNYYLTDVTEANQVSQTVKSVIEDFKRIDILINNAGIATVEPMEEHTLKDWQKVLAANLTSVFLFTKFVGRVMIEQRYGKIINISSMYGRVGNTFMPASSYHATKGAVNTLTKAVSAEWAKYNITVNAIGPGFFATEMTQELVKKQEFHNFVKEKCPMKRIGREGELDGALLLFASDLSSYITGQILYVDGGWTSV